MLLCGLLLLSLTLWNSQAVLLPRPDLLIIPEWKECWRNVTSALILKKFSFFQSSVMWYYPCIAVATSVDGYITEVLFIANCAEPVFWCAEFAYQKCFGSPDCCLSRRFLAWVNVLILDELGCCPFRSKPVFPHFRSKPVFPHFFTAWSLFAVWSSFEAREKHEVL